MEDYRHTIWSKACTNSCLPSTVPRSVTIQCVTMCNSVAVASACCFFMKYWTPRLIMVAVLSRGERPENDSNVRGISSARGHPITSRYCFLAWFRIRSFNLQQYSDDQLTINFNGHALQYCNGTDAWTSWPSTEVSSMLMYYQQSHSMTSFPTI